MEKALGGVSPSFSLNRVALRGPARSCERKKAPPGFATQKRPLQGSHIPKIMEETPDSDDEFEETGYGLPGFHGSPEGLQESPAAAGNGNENRAGTDSPSDNDDVSGDDEGESHDSDFEASPRRQRLLQRAAAKKAAGARRKPKKSNRAAPVDPKWAVLPGADDLHPDASEEFLLKHSKAVAPGRGFSKKGKLYTGGRPGNRVQIQNFACGYELGGCMHHTSEGNHLATFCASTPSSGCVLEADGADCVNTMLPQGQRVAVNHRNAAALYVGVSCTARMNMH